MQFVSQLKKLCGKIFGPISELLMQNDLFKTSPIVIEVGKIDIPSVSRMNKDRKSRI